MLAKPFTLSQLAELTGADAVGDRDYLVTGIDGLETATSGDISFLANPRYRPAMHSSKAGIICVDNTTPRSEGRNYLISQNPSATFQTIAALFRVGPSHSSGFSGIHPTAVIDPTALISPLAHIGPYVVIDQGASVGEHTRIFAHVYIGAHTKIGTHCLIHAHVTLREGCTLGNRVVLQPGAVIGSCGFGYLTDAQGKHVKLEQLGSVELGDDVEIGANTTVDRARFKATRIAEGTKIDNLVQIGHNVQLGPNNIVVSQTGIAGSAETGRNVVFGGQAGVVGHVKIGDGVIIATRGGVSKDLPTPGKYAGGPTMELSEYNRQQVHLRKISQYVKKLDALEERINRLESSS